MNEPPINELVTRNIRALMNKRGIDAAKLSRAIGLNPTGIYDILSGKSRSPKIDTIDKIATGLGVPITALFNRSIDDDILAGTRPPIRAEIASLLVFLSEDELQMLRRQLIGLTAPKAVGTS
jgi:transcriptional regulator with XRE-family HTH domain